MDKESQSTDEEVQQVIEELHVHDHRLVSSSEGSAVTHEAHQEDDFIAHLGKDE